MAAKDLIKYLDSNKMEDLSSAKEHINRAVEAATIISGNRVVYLVSIGLTQEEITEITNQIEADLADTEAE